MPTLPPNFRSNRSDHSAAMAPPNPRGQAVQAVEMIIAASLVPLANAAANQGSTENSGGKNLGTSTDPAVNNTVALEVNSGSSTIETSVSPFALAISLLEPQKWQPLDALALATTVAAGLATVYLFATPQRRALMHAAVLMALRAFALTWGYCVVGLVTDMLWGFDCLAATWCGLRYLIAAFVVRQLCRVSQHMFAAVGAGNVGRRLVDVIHA